MLWGSKVNEVAKYIINTLNDRNIEITHLKLQKLLYFSQKKALKDYNTELFKEDFEAWVHGPVLPFIYKKYAIFGWDPIPKQTTFWYIDSKEKAIINETLEEFQLLTGRQLEDLSHEDNCWIESRKGLLFFEPTNEIMTKTSIKNS